jgi:hypothetical protein
MKALSIIGLIMSIFGMVWSMINIAANINHNSDDTIIGIGPLFIGFLFFLAFSIITTVYSFKNRN